MKRALPALAAVALVAACRSSPPGPAVAACVSPAPPGTVTVDTEVRDGRALPEPHRVAVPLHSTIQVRVGADRVVPVHIHGYEVTYDAAPGAPGYAAFAADRAGLFDVEAHPDVLLVQIEVR
jgi:hypothetical protein